MRISFITNNYTPYSGGVVHAIQATIAELQKQGHEVQLITLNFLRLHNDPEWVFRIPSLFHFCYKQNHGAIPWRPTYYLNKYLTDFKPDIIHLHHPFLLGALGLKWAQKHQIKTIFTHHTIYDAYLHYVPFLGRLLKPLLKKQIARFCAQVDRVIVPSSMMQSYISTHSIVLASGIRSTFSAQSFTSKLYKKPYQLLYVGRFTKEKNVPLLFDLMTKLSEEYELTLVGYGTEFTYLNWYAYKKCMLFKERVRFIVKPDLLTLIDQYKMAHFFLFPSQTDTQGLVLAESMACSTPVIAIDGPGQRDIIDGSNGIIVADKYQMRDAIQSIDTQIYSEMQRSAFQTAQRYTTKKLVLQLVEQYHDL